MEEPKTDRPSEPEEVVRYRTGLHWVTFLGPAALLIIGGLSVPTKGTSALIMAAVALLWGVYASLRYRHTRFEVTETRFTIRMDSPRAWKFDIPLLAMEGVDVHQPALGKILDFGKIIIVAGGGKRHAFRMVRSPLRLSEEIGRYARRARNRDGDERKTE